MKIMVAMSGGVDSTMTAKMLKEAGHEIVGCYMKLHDKPGYHEENIRKVNKVADYLGIKVHILDLRDKFNEMVYMPFVNSYKQGLTPNPCALCNRFIKFGALLDFAKQNGCEKLATGHYVRIVNGLITTATDPSKDQSYFIAQIPKHILSDMIFPLGDKFKADIKEAAKAIPVLAEFGTQAESSEICFVETTYIDVLKKHYNTDLPGEVVDESGKVVGKHQGYMHYTVGKRRGFEVRGAHEPHFVLDIEASKNRIIVGEKESLAKSEIELSSLNSYINESEFDAEVKIRYRSHALPAKIIVNGEQAKVVLSEPAYGVARGQLCVAYRNSSDGAQVIASGFIV
ncbi:tRNA-specific 2-thiouridylase MnmA [Campylobacter sp. 19-13652]|nr:tRNA-specific 2-thiouridylase MnmA [Campylobacter sp. 19-13652]